MYLVKLLVTEVFPDYLSNLPIPQTWSGWSKLSFIDWLRLIPPSAVFGGFCYMVYLAYAPGVRECREPKFPICNPKVRKYEKKVVDQFDTENIVEQAAFCRCWRSKNWPYCDGSHAEYNFEAADNIGPLVAKRYQNPKILEQPVASILDNTKQSWQSIKSRFDQKE